MMFNKLAILAILAASSDALLTNPVNTGAKVAKPTG